MRAAVIAALLLVPAGVAALAQEAPVQEAPAQEAPAQEDATTPPAVTWAPAPTVELPAFDPARARAIYDAKCRTCHGRSGAGDGPTARYLDPPPRDFTRGVYKLHSTPSGASPTPTDLYVTISAGMPGTAMPAWSGLSEADRWQLVQLVMGFGKRPRRGQPRVLVVDEPPPSTAAAIARGKRLYARLGCAQCHGAEGRGDGPSAASMRDDTGRPILPFDLRRGQSFRGGCAPEDVFTTLLSGVGGTPMPSYDGAVTPDEAWDLVHYLRSWFTDAPTCAPRSTHR